jgi:hypothetical protein
MDVLLTFDVEVWCNNWKELDERFPASYQRYVYGSSRKGNFALPYILDTLNRYGLKGVFFVEPMFARRFGIEYLRTIVEMLKACGQEIQLHLHPEWTDEITPSPLDGTRGKRQHLTYYSQDEQTRLIRYGLETLEEVGVLQITAFRAGSFAANRDTFAALVANHIGQDSSVNATVSRSVPDLREFIDLYRSSIVEGVEEYPMSVFVDGFGRPRHAQLGACSASEMIGAIEHASAVGWRHFVILGHNFELLRHASVEPDSIVVGRFESLCQYLSRNADEVPTKGFRTLSQKAEGPGAQRSALPTATFAATLRRHSEQMLRRIQG